MTRWRRAGLIAGALVPLVLLAVGFMVSGGIFTSAAERREEQLDARFLAATKSTPEALVKALAIDPAQDAASDYRSVSEMNAAKPEIGRALLALETGSYKTSTPAERKAAIDALPTVEPILALVRKATALPRCSTELGWFDVTGKTLSNTLVSRIGHAFCTAAVERSRKGDWRGALEDLAVPQAMARQLDDGSVLLISLQFYRSRIEASVIRAIQQMAEQHGGDPGFLTAAQDRLADFGPLEGLETRLPGDLAMKRGWLRQIKSRGEIDPSLFEHLPDGVADLLIRSAPFRASCDAHLVRTYRKMTEAIPNGPDQDTGAWAAAKVEDAKIESDTSLAGTVAHDLVYGFEGPAQSVLMMKTRRNLAVTALRLLQEFDRTGKQPAEVSVHDAASEDPFSGRPLHYRREANGFLLYSVGPDGVDDGGKERPPGSTTGTYDIVVRFNWPQIPSNQGVTTNKK